MEGLDLRWMWKRDRWAGLAFANENVWSRAARRKKQRSDSSIPRNADIMELDGSEEDEEMDENEAEGSIAIGLKITLTSDSVGIRWLQGFDYVLFESFCGMLRRHLAN
jgi:23S rRNA (adenine1618-N6)-methyltransferase